MKTEIIHWGYDREKIKTGIVHIGVGNFHRAHEEFYINMLLKDTRQSDWGICGIMLLPGDESLYRKLKSQDNIYTLTECGRNGERKVYNIGSMVELIWGVQDPEAVFGKIADKAVKIITMTITEGGYNLDKAEGRFILEDEDVKHDLANPDTPRTVFGFVAEGLRRRMKAGNGPLTLLSCDNLQHNGDSAGLAFTSFFAAQDRDLSAWVAENVTFPNSMVDRITPATRPEDVVRLNEENGTNDAAPVYCEDFLQWVIEDNFIAGRPTLEKVGVTFTQDVTAYENMKLSLLNASHMMLAYPAFLSGYRKVDEAMADSRLVDYLRDFMDKDITPYVSAPDNTDLNLYKQTLLERFGNRSVSDQLSRLCADGISKYPVYVIPNLMKIIRDDANPLRVAFSIASYRHYLKYKIDVNNDVFEINEPWMTDEDSRLAASDDPVDFLEMSAFRGADLKASVSFVKTYIEMAKEIRTKGIPEMLR